MSGEVNVGSVDGLIKLIDKVCESRRIAITGYHLYGVEIGSHRGRSAALMLSKYERLMLHMIDSWCEHDGDSDYSKSGDSVAKLTSKQQIENYQEALRATLQWSGRRHVTKLTSERAAGRWGHRKFDFIFVDGDHSYSGCSSDIALWWPMLYPGGAMIFHDYFHPRNAKGSFGVKKAVDELAEREGLEIVEEGDCVAIFTPQEPEKPEVEMGRRLKQAGFNVDAIKEDE